MARSSPTSPSPERTVTLSLISHTNAGKTTLARTLLRNEVGEVRDAPHVTLFNESFTLLEERGHLLRLWDTPGFGDSARLLKRLQREKNPVLWFLTQTWDRVMDRPLWCSQQALKNVREEADVVLYLVNAGEPPEAANYIGPEMEILSWLKRPVLVLLNQTGDPGTPEIEKAEVERWRTHLSVHSHVGAVLPLDAFARCWIQEDRLMDTLLGLLPETRRKPFQVLKEAWHRRNQEVFEDAQRLLGELLTAAVLDGVPVRAESMLERLGFGRAEINQEYQEAREKLAGQLAERMERTTDALILLHGLEGRGGSVSSEVLSDDVKTPQKVSESVWGVLGSFAGGAMGGLLADLKMGGMTFGGGALIGGLATGVAAYAVILSYNLVRGKDDQLHWSKEHFREQVRLVLLCYLTVAHYGRGRGRYQQEGSQPTHWRGVADEVCTAHQDQIDQLWKQGVEKQAMPERISQSALKTVRELSREVLARLYPV